MGSVPVSALPIWITQPLKSAVFSLSHQEIIMIITTEPESFITSTVALEKLKALCNPFETLIWGTKTPIYYKDVKWAVINNKVLSTPYSSQQNWSKRKHVERIAYFVLHPEPSPIEIDVGIPSMGYYPEWVVLDGNHRLAAAIYSRCEFIKAYCSGEEEVIEELLYRENS